MIYRFFLKTLKTLQTLIALCLEFLFGTRTQKAVICLPGYVSAHYYILQAVVLDASKSEVLGFKPRGLFHRLFRGLPDLAMYEKIRLSLATQPRIHFNETTEQRGFIKVHQPHLEKPVPSTDLWQRVQVMGASTHLGTIKTGEYEIDSAPVFRLHKDIDYVILSDIDDTIKDSRIHTTTHWSQILKGVVTGHYYSYKPIDGMAELYHELTQKKCLIMYITNTPFQFVPYLMKFLKDSGFPEGPLFPRWLAYGKVRHKWRTLFRLIRDLYPHQKAILIGDSGEKDMEIYRRLHANAVIGHKIDSLYIRHLPGTQQIQDLKSHEYYYKNKYELTSLLAKSMNTTFMT